MTKKEWIIKHAMPSLKDSPPEVQDKLIEDTIGGQAAQLHFLEIALIEFSFGTLFRKFGVKPKEKFRDVRKVVEDREVENVI